MAAGRDRADRGLEVARTRAQSEAVAVPARAEPRLGRPTLRPGRLAHRGRARPPRPGSKPAWPPGLRTLREVAVIPDDQRQRDNQADRAAAVEARQRAARYRAEAERIAAGRDQLVHTAIADYFAARDDARIIDAGSGRLHRKASQVEAAHARREETAWRWAEPQLPGSAWTDQAVQAGRPARRPTGPSVPPSLPTGPRPSREEATAAGLDRRVTSRDHHQQTAIETNQHHARRRDALIAAVEADRATVSPPPPSPSPASRHHDPRPSRGSPTRPAPPTWPNKPANTGCVAQREQILHAHEQAQDTTTVQRGPSLGL